MWSDKVEHSLIMVAHKHRLPNRRKSQISGQLTHRHDRSPKTEQDHEASIEELGCGLAKDDFRSAGGYEDGMTTMSEVQ